MYPPFRDGQHPGMYCNRPNEEWHGPVLRIQQRHVPQQRHDDGLQAGAGRPLPWDHHREGGRHLQEHQLQEGRGLSRYWGTDVHL